MSHKKTRKNRTAKSFGDITLNDFANSSICKSRLKKSSNNVNEVIKNIKEDKSWDEKTEEFEGDFIEELDEDGNVVFVIKKTEPRRRKKTISSCEDVKCGIGNDYPIDIWFIISSYIRPEDVGKFAGICRASFEVVCTAKFWYCLYRRYYTSVPNMPEQLQPECLVRKYSLRTSVIRALYYMYPPFVNKIKSDSTTMEVHPDILCKRQCESLWHQKQKGQWIYYFKMRERRDNTLQHSRSDFKQPDLLEMLDDVSANPDEHCRVLQIVCKHFIGISPLLGQVLTSASLTLSQGFRHHRLQLCFGSGVQGYRSPDGATTSTIVLDPVINYKVLDWWHPLYPHTHSMQCLLNHE
ncbi:unnamed protein product [Phaedon cochleariae]|uniref:Transmembrane protein 183 n=1 Tax=Phaedon cochleariae TaxID=80249 RepID=A0A9N9SIJ6_PHACE|nr:unnamed protein product [Phaedon cochleariae]